MGSDKIKYLLEWCSSVGIRIDPRLEIMENYDAGICVFSRDEYISNSKTLVHIPKSAVLSVKSCSQSKHITAEPYGHGAHLALAHAVYIEMLYGQDSHWFGYLQSLPSETVDLALFWGVDVSNGSLRFRDGQEAVTWVTGTELEKEMRGSTQRRIIDYYFAIAERHLSQLVSHQCVSLAGFLHAYSLVSSRAFLVDAYHGLAMVPIADAFNHTQENHVHLECDFDVCTVCGSLEECSHDRDDDSKAIAATARSEAQLVNGSYEMVSNSAILPHSQVFNSYGETLTNAQLLVRYGFALEDNENDCITWEWSDLFASISGGLSRNDVMQLYTQAIELWPSTNSGWTHSGLVYSVTASAAVVKNTRLDPEKFSDQVELCLNGDGKISHQLWLYCTLLGYQKVVRATNSGVEAIMGQLREVARLLMKLDEVDSSRGVGQLRRLIGCPRTPILEVLSETVRTVLCLCRSRRARIGKDLLYASDVNKKLDEIPPHMTRTRKIMVQVLSEKSLLESAESAWSEVEKIVDWYQALGGTDGHKDAKLTGRPEIR